jgi:hypothetical protein
VEAALLDREAVRRFCTNPVTNYVESPMSYPPTTAYAPPHDEDRVGRHGDRWSVDAGGVQQWAGVGDAADEDDDDGEREHHDRAGPVPEHLHDDARGTRRHTSPDRTHLDL